MSIAEGRSPRRIKILFVIDCLCESGGAERALLKAIRLLPGDKFDPALVTFRIDEGLDIVHDLPCKLHVLPLRRTYDFNAFRVGWRLSRLIRSEHIDIVQTVFETSDLWAGPIARMSGVPVLISSRRDMGILRSPGHALAYRWLRSVFDQVQTVSEMVRCEFIRTDGLDPSRVVTVYNGVSLSAIDVVRTERECVRRRLGLGEASHVITTVGHVRKVKGFDVLIRAAALVRRRIPRAVFLIAGEPHDRKYHQELKVMCTESGVEHNVQFLGGVPDPIPLLKASDLFCLPSRSEGLSNALLEAMACALPAVASRVGGNPEVIKDGETGCLFNSEDAPGLAECILELLTDPARRSVMGATARRAVEQRFSDERMMSQLIGEYEKLVGNIPVPAGCQ